MNNHANTYKPFSVDTVMLDGLIITTHSNAPVLVEPAMGTGSRMMEKHVDCMQVDNRNDMDEIE